MARTYGKAQDLIDFTRASSGTALRPISYGAELVTNGDFDSDSDWSKGIGWTISGGVATHASGTGSDIYSSVSLVAGTVYAVVYTIIGMTAGAAQIKLTGGTNVNGVVRGSDGTYTEYLVSKTGNTFVSVTAGTSFDGSIDNISVKEVTFDTSDGDLILFNHPNNIPRIEYDANGNLLGLLVEEARTNIIRYSENFSLWSTNGSITRTISSTPSPDGQLNAYDVTDSGSGDEFIARYDTIPTTVTTYVSTVFAEKTSGDAHYLNIANFIYGGSSQYLHATFNTNTGEFTAVSGISISDTFVEDRGSYWRIGIKVTNTGANNTFQVRLYPAYNSDGGTVRNASTTGSKTLFGVQLEAGSFPTSYIPNYGTSGGVTRSADVASLSTSAFGENEEAGTFVVEFDSNYETGGTGYPRVFEYGATGTATQRINIFNGEANDDLSFGMYTDNVAQANGVLIANNGGYVSAKAGFSYKKNLVYAVANGSVIITDTSADIIPSQDRNLIKIGGSVTAGDQVNGHIKSLKYYPRALTADQIEALTA